MRWLSFYQNYFQLKEGLLKQNVICPFHADKEPSCSVDLEEGLWYCHSCQLGGDVFSFYMKYNNCSFTMAKNAILGNDKVPVLTPTEVEVAHNKLLLSEQLQQLLLVKRGWTIETIQHFHLGWLDERVYIPIYDNHNTLVNIRKYDVLHKTKEKFKGVVGFNTIRLFPIYNLKHDTIIINAGEPDCILANQLGLPSVTFTGGEGAFRAELLPLFQDKQVYICYDIDDKGKSSAKNLSKRLLEFAKTVHIINLPKGLPDNGDFTDLFMMCCDDNMDFEEIWNKLIQNALPIEKEQADSTVHYETVDFYEAVREQYYNKHITFKAISIGKNFSPFFAPKKINLQCEFTRGDSCKGCKLFATGGTYSFEINDYDSLDLIKCSQGEQRNRIKTLCGITGCNQFKLDMETQTIEELFIAPIIDSERIDRQFIIRKVYSKSWNIQLNKTYKFFGKTIPDAKTQEATHIFDKQLPELTDLDTFQLEQDDISRLRLFNPVDDSVEAVDVKIKDICYDLAYNVPEVIVGRENLILACDLVFHSVLRFKFLDSLIEKGWTELLILGDTRTGKTKTAVKLCRHYKVGEYITLESATLPGLVGGMSQVGRDIMFSWGVLPINDGRAVILDEVNGLDVNAISNLSAIRDNGIAERTVVGSTRKTNARVRIIWISNPRSSGLRLSHYSSGVEAIRELIGRSEDISRLDFALIVAKEDVDIHIINRHAHKKPLHVYTQDLCNKCLMWAWSRKENDVKFTDEAENAILKYAVEMSEVYSDVIPLVQGSVQRIKLAKLSVALACRLFSTEDGIKVIVKKSHVDYVVRFLYDIYNSTYFGYKDFSENKKEESTVTERARIKQTINALDDKENFIAKMLATNTILFDDLKDFSGKTKDQTADLKSFLVSNNCLKRKKTFYYKSPEFIKLLKEMLSDIRDEAPF